MDTCVSASLLAAGMSMVVNRPRPETVMKLATKANTIPAIAAPIMSRRSAAQASIGSTSIDGGTWFQNAPTETTAAAVRMTAVSQGRALMT